MKKFIIGLMLSAILLLCVATPIVQGATHVSVTWGPAWHPATYLPGYNATWFALYEQPAQSSLTSYITSTAPQAGANWVAANNYGSSTTASNIYANSQTIQSSSTYDFLATFHVGDFYLQPIGTTYHYAYYCYNNQSQVVDEYLYTNTTGAKHKFTFIWTCANAWVDMPPNTNNYYYVDTTGVVGMAYAWTHKNNMSTDGYKSPDNSGVAYIGFRNTSKYLTDNSESAPTGNYNYGDFCKEFYYNLLVKNYSVKMSLDKATIKMTNGASQVFTSTNLYKGYPDPSGTGNNCTMRVLGDGNMVLPY